ncbi:hypothetical protein GCM10029992_36610 [Glycomyces albus]
MASVDDYFPELAPNTEGQPQLDWWEDHRTGDVKATPTGDREAQIAAFAHWAMQSADANYEELKSRAGYVVWIAYLDFGRDRIPMELYLRRPYSPDDYWQIKDGISNAIYDLQRR